jgi:hypothetical protein
MKLHDVGRHMLVCGARKQPAQVIDQSDFRLVVGERNVLPHVLDAMARARELYETEVAPRAHATR